MVQYISNLYLMKNLKTLAILFVAFLVFSCSKDDNGSDSNVEASFTATIDGGTFTNYSAMLGFYDLQSTDGTLTISVTDSNNNVIRIFMNSTGGLSAGVVKQVGDIDGNGFGTAVAIRDQGAQITYNSISGSIRITENVAHPDDSGRRLVSGNFNIVANNNTSADVTMTGSYSNLDFFPQ